MIRMNTYTTKDNHEHNAYELIDDIDNYILIENIKNWDHVNPNQVKRWMQDIAIECINHHVTLDDIGLQYDKMYDCISKDFYDALTKSQTHTLVYNPSDFK